MSELSIKSIGELIEILPERYKLKNVDCGNGMCSIEIYNDDSGRLISSWFGYYSTMIKILDLLWEDLLLIPEFKQAYENELEFYAKFPEFKIK